jgi:hypothetical protein
MEIQTFTHCFLTIPDFNPLASILKSRCGTGIARPCEAKERGEKHLSFLLLQNLPSILPLQKVRKYLAFALSPTGAFSAPKISGGIGGPWFLQRRTQGLQRLHAA